MPSWLLLLWSGLAATCAAAVVGVLIGGVPSVRWGLAPRPRSRLHALAWSVAAGVFMYPVAYGIVFELLHRADFRVGLLIGAAHGAVLFAAAQPRSRLRAAIRCGFAHLVYGTVIAFLYVTP